MYSDGTNGGVAGDTEAVVVPVASEWVEYWDESAGASYFFNTVTQVCNSIIQELCWVKDGRGAGSNSKVLVRLEVAGKMHVLVEISTHRSLKRKILVMLYY